MRHLRPSFAPSSSRFAAVAGVCAVSLWAATASAAQPAVPPAPASTTTEVAAPAEGPVVVVSTTTTAPAPAPTAAPAPATTPAPAPVVTAPAVEPAPASDAAIDRLDAARARKKAEKGRAVGLMAAGFSVWGSTYLVSALIGAASIDLAGDEQVSRYGRWMTVPVVGPFGAAFNARSATGTLFSTTLGLAQAAGFTMAVIGVARHRRIKRDLQLMAMPTQGGGHIGMRMRF